MQFNRQISTPTQSTLQLLQVTTHLQWSLKTILWPAYIYPRNNKRRNICVDGSSICLNQLSVHFRNMSRSSRGSVYRSWRSTRLRLESKANRWLHKSCASSVTQDNETKTTLSNVQMSWTIMSVSQLKATLPGQNSGPMWLLNAKKQFRLH